MVVVKKDLEKSRENFILKNRFDNAEEESGFTNICLRIPKSMIAKIDSLVKQNPGYFRTTWILQALQEKINKSI